MPFPEDRLIVAIKKENNVYKFPLKIALCLETICAFCFRIGMYILSSPLWYEL